MQKKSGGKINKDKITTIIYPVLFGIVIFILWQTQVIHAIIGTDDFTLPLPTRIFTIISENVPEIIDNVIATLIVSISGLVLGSFLGYGLAIIATLFPKWGVGGISIASALSAVPIVAIAPILNNLTKDFSDDAYTRSMIAKTLVVMIVCTAAMAINAYRGLNELKPFSEDLMRSFAAKKSTIFLKLRIPNSLPYIFTALKVSVPSSIISALVSEYFAEYIIGVGRQIRENIVLAQYSTAWAYIAVACFMGIIMYCILLAVEGIMLKGRR